jgi:hypothetical protein
VQTIADQFLRWVRPNSGAPSRYDLYWHFLHYLWDPESFWSEISAKAARLDDHRRKDLHYLFMGAVQFLVLAALQEPLAEYFPASLSFAVNQDRSKAGRIFEAFYRSRHVEIWDIVQTRQVQINKLGRLSLFAPMFMEVARRSSQQLAFVDVGCSVGFGLLWQHFNYSYPGGGQIKGQETVNEMSCLVEGTPSIPLSGKLPNPAFLCGIEAAPLSWRKEEDVRGLLALTAPDDHEGRSQLRKGIDVLAQVETRVEAGCVLHVLPRLASECGPDKAFVVYHSMTMHHLREDGKEAMFHRALERIAETRRVFEIGVEWV